MGFGQAPFERAVALVHFFHHPRVHLIFIGQQAKPMPGVGGLRIDEFVEVWFDLSKHSRHFVGPFLLVIHVGVIQVLAHFVLEKPAQLAIEERLIGVVAQALVAQ